MASQGPLSPGTVTDDSFAGQLEWINPNNAKISDDNYATNTITSPDYGSYYSHFLKANNFSFSIPSEATINGIIVEIERHKTSDAGSTVRDALVNIIKADGTRGTTNRANPSYWNETTGTYYTYGSSSDLWGETWDADKINNLNFGVLLYTNSVRESDIVADVVALVDHIRITVYYTEPQGVISPFPSYFRL